MWSVRGGAAELLTAWKDSQNLSIIFSSPPPQLPPACEFLTGVLTAASANTTPPSNTRPLFKVRRQEEKEEEEQKKEEEKKKELWNRRSQM